ncbi:MAG: energy-coupling factor transport system permease protein [Nocardioidaceae bacterium]|nr:energy-coupling factor transport system permease protein [Nocardioidaceae bacterium]
MATSAGSTVRANRGTWRTIDIITAAMIGVVLGVAYWGWSSAYNTLLTPLTSLLGPSQGLLGGPWLMAGVVAGLVVRRPGAAFLAEILAAVVEATLVTEWGWSTVISGALQGLGVEAVLAVFLYRRFGWAVAALAGAMAAFAEWCYEWHAYWVGYSVGWKLAYLGFFALSGAVVAGVGGWYLTRAVAATGAIDALPAGQQAARDHAV